MRQICLYKSSRITLLSDLVSQLEYSLLNPCFATDKKVLRRNLDTMGEQWERHDVCQDSQILCAGCYEEPIHELHSRNKINSLFPRVLSATLSALKAAYEAIVPNTMVAIVMVNAAPQKVKQEVRSAAGSSRNLCFNLVG
jgi:hypothetical protein